MRQSEKLFLEKASSLAHGAMWRSATDFPAQAVIEHSRSADLIVYSRPSGAQPEETFAHPGELIVGAGTPVLVLPPALESLKGNKVLVGWKNTRESRRAIWDALPYLKRA